ADYLKNHPDEALALIAKESKIPVEALAKSIKTIDWDLQFTDADLQTLTQTKNFLKDTNVIKKDFAVNELVEKKYLNNLGLK
ncbi:MAG: hypothetical protein AAGU23_12350, partial [Bacillota bacterium]